MNVLKQNPVRERIYEIVDKGLLGNGLDEDEILELYRVDSESLEASHIMWAGRQLQMQLCDGYAEVHAQIGLNASTCGHNCKFCSFAACNDVRDKGKFEMEKAEVKEYAKCFVEAGANLLLVLATGNYNFELAAEMVEAVRSVIDKDMPLLVNFEDMTLNEVKTLKAAGANGAYHAVRMREGIDTGLPVEQRLQTIHNLDEAGMSISTCVEPIGPEHTPEELTEATMRCMSYPNNSAGCGRRITVPGTLVAERGELSDYANAKNVAIYRLAAGKYPMLNCAASTSASAAAGANLAWAEMGFNPRDTVSRTEAGGRGLSVETTKRFLKAAGYEIKKGYSKGWIK